MPTILSKNQINRNFNLGLPSFDFQYKISSQILSDANYFTGKLSGLLGYFYKPDNIVASLVTLEVVISNKLENINCSLIEQFELKLIGKKAFNKSQELVSQTELALLRGEEYLKNGGKIDGELIFELAKIMKLDLNLAAKTLVDKNIEDEIKVFDDLISWLNTPANNLNELIKAIAIQIYFEIQKPFDNENGKLGRILFLLYLKDKNLLSYPIMCLSSFILLTKPKYSAYLKELQFSGEYIQLTEYLLLGISQKAEFTLNALYEILNQKDDCNYRLRKYLPKIYSPQLVDFLYTNPFCNKKTLCEALQITRNTATKYFKLLSKFGFLSMYSENKEKVYFNKNFLNIFV